MDCQVVRSRSPMDRVISVFPWKSPSRYTSPMSFFTVRESVVVREYPVRSPMDRVISASDAITLSRDTFPRSVDTVRLFAVKPPSSTCPMAVWMSTASRDASSGIPMVTAASSPEVKNSMALRAVPVMRRVSPSIS